MHRIFCTKVRYAFKFAKNAIGWLCVCYKDQNFRSFEIYAFLALKTLKIESKEALMIFQKRPFCLPKQTL